MVQQSDNYLDICISLEKPKGQEVKFYYNYHKIRNYFPWSSVLLKERYIRLVWFHY